MQAILQRKSDEIAAGPRVTRLDNAVHAAMAGKTNMVIGRWHGHHVNLPISVVTVRRRKVGLQGDLWLSVLEATGQPARFGAA